MSVNPVLPLPHTQLQNIIAMTSLIDTTSAVQWLHDYNMNKKKSLKSRESLIKYVLNTSK